MRDSPERWYRRPAVRAWAIVALVSAFAFGHALDLDLETSRTEMVSADDPDQALLLDLAEDMGGDEPLVVAVEAISGLAPPPERVRRVVDDLARDLAELSTVRSVFHRVDREWSETHGFWLAPAAEQERFIALLEGLFLPAQGAGALGGWTGLNQRIARRLLDPEADLPAIRRLLEEEEAFHRDVEAWGRGFDESELERWFAGPNAEELQRQAYLSTRSGDLYFLVVQPKDRDDALEVQRPFVHGVRRRVHELLRGHPGLRAGLTGFPALNVEEMDAVESDTVFTSVIAGLLVVAVAFSTYRRRRHALLVLLVLGIGVLWSLAAARLAVGHLNLITSSFISILIGVGIDFSLHPVSEFELLARRGRDFAAKEAFARTRAAVSVSALTTGGVFLTLLLMRYEGFAEMGVVAGLGVVLCFLATFLLLPTLLRTLGSETGPNERPPLLDRIWTPGAARGVVARPKAIVLSGLVLSFVLGAFALRVEYDGNVFELIPQDARSLHYLERMAEDSDLSPHLNVARVGSREELLELRRRAEASPEIARMESLLDLVEIDAPSRERMARLRQILGDLDLARRPDPVSRPQLLESLGAIERALEKRPQAAELQPYVERVRTAIRSAPESVSVGWRLALEGWLEGANTLARELSERFAAAAPARGNLPRELEERLVGGSGRFLAYLHPNGDVMDPTYLARFNRACRSLTPEVAGWPIMFEKITGRITSGFSWSFAAGGALVLLSLAIAFRSLRTVALALIPLVFGVLWLLGLMGILGVPFNLGNLVALPIILGVGIDSGVHLAHRVTRARKDEVADSLHATGRGIIAASLTTMGGFGSLALASHRGMASLGLVLLLGVLSTLLAALFLFPSLMFWLGYGRGEALEATRSDG